MDDPVHLSRALLECGPVPRQEVVIAAGQGREYRVEAGIFLDDAIRYLSQRSPFREPVYERLLASRTCPPVWVHYGIARSAMSLGYRFHFSPFTGNTTRKQPGNTPFPTEETIARLFPTEET